jgi:cyclomaltodextrinase
VEDHIFGTLATDDLKLVHHRAARRGLQHNHDITPRDPQPDQPVTIMVRVGTGLDVEQIACYYTLDNSEPVGRCGTAHNGQTVMLEPVEVVWDTLAWSYLKTWQAVLPPQPDGTIVKYRIGAWTDDRPEVFADWPDAQLTAERAAAAFFRDELLPETPPGDPGSGHTFTYHVDRLDAPTWARDAVIYQVFVDRFYPGDGQDWQQTDDLSGICGGTLWGVRDKLDYIADLGATCIWLSPIFISPTHHGYDATDYFHVEPRLGGDEALHALVTAAHARGIRILLDYACNHISSEHPIFQQALADPSSSCYDWFLFDDSPLGYRAFFEVPSMPQVNAANPDARRWLIDIARYWVREFDVDGYRLDYANGPGPDFWPDFRTACKSEKPDCFCFGEIVDSPSAQAVFIGRLDGCLDFHLGDMLRKTYAWQERTEEELALFIRRHRAYFPSDFVMPTFIDNHDMDRFLYIARGDKEALRRAAACQMCLPGPPIIYYGTEIGLSQSASKADGLGLEVSRTPMVWDERQDRDLLAFYKHVIRQRRKLSKK